MGGSCPFLSRGDSFPNILEIEKNLRKPEVCRVGTGEVGRAGEGVSAGAACDCGDVLKIGTGVGVGIFLGRSASGRSFWIIGLDCIFIGGTAGKGRGIVVFCPAAFSAGVRAGEGISTVKGRGMEIGACLRMTG